MENQFLADHGESTLSQVSAQLNNSESYNGPSIPSIPPIYTALNESKYAALMTGGLTVGAKVDADFKGQGRWFPGRISKVHGDGTYSVDYDDGDKEKRVPEDRIIASDPPPPNRPANSGAGAFTVKKKAVIIKWTPEEENALKILVEQHGAKDWSRLALLLHSQGFELRTNKTVGERWKNNLNPDIITTEWTEEEMAIMEEAHRELGNKWAEIAKRLPGRTDNAVKTRFRSLQTHKPTAVPAEPQILLSSNGVPMDVVQPEGFRIPYDNELLYKDELKDAKVCIYWDGDRCYYPAKIVDYDPETDLFFAVYGDADDPNYDPTAYSESLRTTPWLIWGPESAEVAAERRNLPSRQSKLSLDPDAYLENKRSEASKDPNSKLKVAGKLPPYEQMALEAVAALNDKKGTSLPSIRKYIKQYYPVGHMATASFNSKTLRGCNTAVEFGWLDRDSHHFKLSLVEKNRRRTERENAIRDAKKGIYHKSYSGGGRRADYDPAHAGTALENNGKLREKVEASLRRRDTYLVERYNVLKAMLPEKNYFSKLEEKKNKLASQQSVVQVPATVSMDVDSETIPDHPSEDSAMDIVPPQSSSDSVDISAPASLSVNDADEAPEDVPDVPVEEMLSMAMRGVKILKQTETLKAELHEHQRQGISWMVHMFQNGMPMILGDQMGLGKTLQSIGFLNYVKEQLKHDGPFLIVVPLSVLSNWIAEIERFCPKFRAVRFHGPKDERMRLKAEELGSLQDFDIVVTTYEMLVSEVNFFKRKYVWTSIIVDEGHRLKNEKSQLSEKLRTVPCLSKVILTGTPLQNNLRELWALFHFLAPDIFTPSTAERFEDGFDAVRNRIDNRMLRLSRKVLGVFMLRRLKIHVAITLPSRRELTVLVPLTDRQTAWYKQLLSGLDAATMDTVMSESEAKHDALPSSLSQQSLASATSNSSEPTVVANKGTKRGRKAANGDSPLVGDTDWRKLMNLLLQLRKVCNHIYLMPDAAPDPYKVDVNLVHGSGKLLMLDRMLPRLRQDGHRVLLFSQFTSMLDILEDYCEFRDLPFVRLDGDTNRVQRRLDVRRFNAPNSPLFIFLISTRAGGLGLNLASADTVILYDSDWNPQVDLQAMERAHRIGQTKPVRVYRLVCSGSVEERMVNRAEKKLYLNAMVAEAEDEDMDENGALVGSETEVGVEDALGIGGSVMSKSELSSLIRFGANAVIEGASGTMMSDLDLDRLLERQGRDKPYISAPGTETATTTQRAEMSQKSVSDLADGDALEQAQAALRSRMESLKEVDLRQLGSTLYAKKKHVTKDGADVDSDNIIGWDGEVNEAGEEVSAKRARKERIVMVSGKGTGYGAAVPILQDNFEVAPAPSSSSSILRRRAWSHQPFCCLCGKSRNQPSHCKCAHCPRMFHADCLETYEIPRNAGMFICPHHKCAVCTRSTASAGGLLFRCKGCLTSYCEDCLPMDEVESIGRCKELEEFGYSGKQAYFIKCPSCCIAEGFVASGVDGDKKPAAPVITADDIEDETEGDAAAEDEAQDDGLLDTQLMRVFWEQQPDSEDERELARKQRREERRTKRKPAARRPSRRASQDDSDDDSHDDDDGGDDDDDSECSDEEDERYDSSHISIPKPCSLLTALELLLSHPRWAPLHKPSASATQDALIVQIREKSGNDRYRTTTGFVNDIKSYLNSVLKAVIKPTTSKANGGAPSGGQRAAARAAEMARERESSQTVEMDADTRAEMVEHSASLMRWIDSHLQSKLSITKD